MATVQLSSIDITVPCGPMTLLSTRIQDFKQALIASLDTTARIRHELKDKVISILKEDGDYLYNEPAYQPTSEKV